MASNPNRRRGGRFLKRAVLFLLAVTLLPSLFGMTRAVVACRMWEKPADDELGSAAPDADIQKVTDAIPGYARAEDQTYLTFPEWYIVYSADEYAAFISKNPPSAFPYFKAIAQYWQSYNNICGVTHARYPLNGSYQFTLGFIGVSFTAENMLKGLYETTIGRITEWIGADGITEEDAYARQTAREYGSFLHLTPWYEFPFGQKLVGLWRGTSLWGKNPIRKWERKFVLTTEYGVKALYGGFISWASGVTYGGPDETKIYAVAEGVTKDMPGPDLEVIQSIDKKRDIIYISRFEVFSQIVPDLTARGLRFIEIAGNDELLVTVIGPKNGDYNFPYGKYLFDLPILTQPGLTRAAIQVRVADLHLFLKELKSWDIQFEHIYDY